IPGEHVSAGVKEYRHEDRVTLQERPGQEKPRQHVDRVGGAVDDVNQPEENAADDDGRTRAGAGRDGDADPNAVDNLFKDPRPHPPPTAPPAEAGPPQGGKLVPPADPPPAPAEW